MNQVRLAKHLEQVLKLPLTWDLQKNQISSSLALQDLKFRLGESSVQFELGEVCHAKSQFGLITQIGVTRVLYHP